jgi:hypothetical protein
MLVRGKLLLLLMVGGGLQLVVLVLLVIHMLLVLLAVGVLHVGFLHLLVLFGGRLHMHLLADIELLVIGRLLLFRSCCSSRRCRFTGSCCTSC